MSAKKEKIKICNRPMRSSSPHRYSKYNQPGRKMDSKFISSALVIYKHPHSRAADENIAYNAQDIRHITEDEKSERRSEEHLRVIIDRYLLRRCARQCSRHSSASCRASFRRVRAAHRTAHCA